LLIYESAVPVSAARHREVSFEPAKGYAFSAGINAVPLMAVEFMLAATEYAIVFTESGDDVLPAAVLGIRPDQNLYLSADSQWQAKYVPAFIRRYPFVFSASEDQKTLTLCIDETHPGINREGRGQRLFGDDGRPSEYVEQVLKFLQDYQAHYARTRVFGKRLKDSNLLEPMQAQVTTPAGEKLMLHGFTAAARERIRTLSGEALSTLAKTDELELLYLHLHSMRNFEGVKDRLIGSSSAEVGVDDTGTAAQASDAGVEAAASKPKAGRKH
jgi:hypothetical protein